MQCDLAPFGGAIDDQDYVANLGGLQSDAGDAGFLDQRTDVDEAGEIEASTDAAEFADLGGECLLGLDPGAIGGGRERRRCGLAERRRGVSAQEFAQRIELQHARGSVEELQRHRSLCYRSMRRRECGKTVLRPAGAGPVGLRTTAYAVGCIYAASRLDVTWHHVPVPIGQHQRLGVRSDWPSLRDLNNSPTISSAEALAIVSRPWGSSPRGHLGFRKVQGLAGACALGYGLAEMGRHGEQAPPSGLLRQVICPPWSWMTP